MLTLANQRGRTQRVHVCRNDGRPQGLVYTKRLDLVVMNGGGADLPTEESFAQAVAEVAHVLAANEGERASTRQWWRRCCRTPSACSVRGDGAVALTAAVSVPKEGQ